MTFTGIDRLTRMWQPAAEALVPVAEIERRKIVKRAIGEDGIVRLDALPEYLPPTMLEWPDAGTVAVGLLLPSYYLPIPYQVRELHAYAATAPTGASIICNLLTHENDDIATVSIAASAKNGSTTGLAVDIDAGRWLRVYVKQVGSGTAGSNMTVVAVMYPMEAT